jgi:hypothetical protein
MFGYQYDEEVRAVREKVVFPTDDAIKWN